MKGRVYLATVSGAASFRYIPTDSTSELNLAHGRAGQPSSRSSFCATAPAGIHRNIRISGEGESGSYATQSTLSNRGPCVPDTMSERSGLSRLKHFSFDEWWTIRIRNIRAFLQGGSPNVAAAAVCSVSMRRDSAH